MNRKVINVLLVLLLFISVLFITLPYIEEYIFNKDTNSIVQLQSENISSANNSELEKEKEKALLYNESLASGNLDNLTKYNYDDLLNVSKNGVMGVIRIPKIKVTLPIFHTANDDVLEKGVGHLTHTSLPIGGKDSLCVLTAHTGYSKNKLFTDIIDLKKGDIFYIDVLNEKLAYKVNNTAIVEPSKVADLSIEKDKDKCVLLTCYPYGVNTHRLLVTGERTEYVEPKEDIENTKNVSKAYIYITVLVLGLILVVIAYYTYKCLMKRKKNAK